MLVVSDTLAHFNIGRKYGGHTSSKEAVISSYYYSGFIVLDSLDCLLPLHPRQAAFWISKCN